MKPKKTVLVGGCFDLLHYGHISFLKQAKATGEYLIVALESDENVRKSKGVSRPIHSQRERKEMLESLSFVDEVITLPVMTTDKEYFELVEKIMPAVIVTTDGDPQENNKQKQAVSVHASFVVIPKIRTPSTSQLAKLLGLE